MRENATTCLNDQNIKISDEESAKLLADATTASNLTHGNVASAIVSHFVHLQNKQIMKDTSFNVQNINISDVKSAEHLLDAASASNLTHGNVTSIIVSPFVNLQNKQITRENATSLNVQNIHISDVQSSKHVPYTTTASNLTHGNGVKKGHLLTFIYSIENQDFIIKCIYKPRDRTPVEENQLRKCCYWNVEKKLGRERNPCTRAGTKQGVDFSPWHTSP
ncbi:hypothetical protein CDAR_586721 [Caerostris darwini]|uniref:Uncharacterized protein n=1 Tax=Caerostris darwini TaxID=1538125 RepID=A0AAV4TKH7_9ARAC|nr:hypothetical protein CDAR_586721 [Caerostris darwini]